MAVLLTTAFLPPVEYVAAIAEGMVLSADRIVPSVVYLEACENYQKQSWRNRCRLFGPMGAEDWSFPVIHRGGSHNGIPVTEVEIDWSGDWSRRFRGAVEAAYGSAAFFGHYSPGLFELLETRPSRLWELNMRSLEWLLRCCGVSAELRMTTDYGVCGEAGRRAAENCCGDVAGGGSVAVTDMRTSFHPKKSNDYLAEHGLDRSYFQVFSPRYGFKGGMSAIDLLFNEGPDSIVYLKRL